MPTFASLAEFRKAVDTMATSMNKAERFKITKAMAVRAQAIAKGAASADLGGDPKFSGWKPPLDTEIKQGGNGEAILHPTKSSAGPWTVAEFGRNQGNAGGFAGPGINRSTGVTARTKAGGLRKVRARKARRWNGTTRGKHTASDAIARMQSTLPPMAEDGMRKFLQKHFDVD